MLRRLLSFIRELHSFSPQRIFLTSCSCVFDAVESCLMNLVLLPFILKAVTLGYDLKYVLVTCCVIMFFVIAYYFFCAFRGKYIYPISDLNILNGFQTKLIKKAWEMEYHYYEKEDFYNDYVLIMNKCNEFAIKTLDRISDLVNNIIMIVSAVIIILYESPYVLFSVLISLVLSHVISNKLNLSYYRREQSSIDAEREKEYAYRILYMEEYSSDLKVTNILNVVLNNFKHSIKKLICVIEKDSARIVFFEFLSELVNLIFSIAVPFLVMAFKFINKGNSDVGDLLLLSSAVIQLSIRLPIHNYLYKELLRLDMYINKYYDFLRIKSEYNYDRLLEDNKVKFENIMVRNLYFQYDCNSDYTLKGVNFRIGKGEKVAIVGDNGAGKSTFLKNLIRLYPVPKNSIFCNGKKIEDYDILEYRKMFSIISQNFMFYSLGLKDNIVMGDKTIDDTIVRDVIEKVGMDIGLISDINSSLTNEFSEEYIGFSGGEKQKIALARLLASGRDFFVMDEPFSALDPISENEMNKLFLRELKDKTAIIVTHRLSSIIDVDRIYVLCKGEIVEKGNHYELMKKRGKYYKMFMSQAKYYQSEVPYEEYI